MGRKRRNNIYKYFIYDEEKKTSKCKISDCKYVLKGHHGSNLLRHFYIHHRSLYDEIIKLNKIKIEISNPELNRSNPSVMSSVIDICSDLVTVHGRPFSLIEDEAFQKLIKLIPGMPRDVISSLNTDAIKEAIKEKASMIHKNICDELDNKLIALKVDVVPIKSKRYLGLNIQYINEGKVVLLNIGVKELNRQITAEILNDYIVTMLSRFEIKTDQIYTITADNGANMNITEEDESLEDKIDVAYDEYYQSLIDKLDFEQIKQEHIDLPRLSVIRCGAHTLQLAIRDALAKHAELLDQCRRIVKVLKNYSPQLRRNNFPQPILDCPTRWHTTADMLQRLLNIKTFCQNISSLQEYIQDNTWADIENILKCLAPCRKLLKSLHEDHLTFGCFYIAWIKCTLEIKKVNTPLALKLGTCMTNKQRAHFDNYWFLSAIYLDPRVNAVLSDEQTYMALYVLKQTYYKLKQMSSESTDPLQMNATQPSTSSASEVDRFLESKFIQKQLIEAGEDIHTEQKIYITNCLDAFLNQYRLPSSANILTYWEDRKHNDPDLYSLANVVLATPASQVSVERLFSSLKFVVDNLGLSINDSIVDDILLVRSWNLINN